MNRADLKPLHRPGAELPIWSGIYDQVLYEVTFHRTTFFFIHTIIHTLYYIEKNYSNMCGQNHFGWAGPSLKCRLLGPTPRMVSNEVTLNAVGPWT